MSKQVKAFQVDGRETLNKLELVLASLGGDANELKLAELEGSGMFSKGEAQFLREFLGGLHQGAADYIRSNPAHLDEGVKSGKISNKQANQVRKELGLLLEKRGK